MLRAQSSSIANAMAATLCVMLILFPKGGFRAGPLPLTWGYLLLFLSVLVCLPYRMLAVKTMVKRSQITLFLCIAPFAILLFYTALAFGIPSLGGFVSSVISLVFLPVLFLWFYPPLLPLLDRAFFLKCFRFCVLAAALFGIFLFFWKPFTGSWIQVPYLTVNADDVGDFANTKNISRGFFLKLISTYNNGNIYGACTLMVLRLYQEVTPKRWQRWTIWIALFLTLSRTVWAGMLFYLLLSIVALLVEQRRSFPILRLGRVAWVVGGMLLAAPLFVLVSSLFGAQSSAFLLDPTLGGRTEQFGTLGQYSIFPSNPSTFFFTEITYLSAVNLFGYVGIPAITLVLLSPVAVLLVNRSAINNPLRRAAFKGLILYAMVSASDGALNFIPVMAFYWFLYMVFMFGAPGEYAPAPVKLEGLTLNDSTKLSASYAS